MSQAIQSISKRLSLREPQKRSLEILHHVLRVAKPSKTVDVAVALEAIKTEFPNASSFERDFVNVCFALATGVGKTRLMGAFIAYLHGVHGIRHFFVVAPNLTIYNKLIQDFTPNTPKYVFQGISEFSIKAPTLVTGDNFEQKPQVLDLFERDDVIINIFNIAKFNARSNDSRKIHRLSEFLGQSYFEYLSKLDDLVLIMDEAHRYRAATSMESIANLKPILGLELTATPQIEGARSRRFQNILYEYSLAEAMRDGFVKEPAVATRENLVTKSVGDDALERIKLEDGIRVHEDTRFQLDLYAANHGVRKVKPFMLVIAADTTHATELVKQIESDDFFKGYYKGKVIEVHSEQKGAEKDANVELLLSVEKEDNPVEIVVHVNMLKEGWDVTNLYTIVPLRKADSRTLVEQSIGRGLRLPYGKRTGDPAVDRLTIIAHDKFQEIVEEARSRGFSFTRVNLDEQKEPERRKIVVEDPVQSALGLGDPVSNGGATSTAGASDKANTGATPSSSTFATPEAKALRIAALEAIKDKTRGVNAVPTLRDLSAREVEDAIVREVQVRGGEAQGTLYPTRGDAEIRHIVREVTTSYIAKTIEIPRITIDLAHRTYAGFREFEVDVSGMNFHEVDDAIQLQSLVTDAKYVIKGSADVHDENSLEDYIVAALVHFDDVDYQTQADLLYNLAGQVIAHLRKRHEDDGVLRKSVGVRGREIANLLHAQMLRHSWEEEGEYHATVGHGFAEIGSMTFGVPESEEVRRYDAPVADKSKIRGMVFGSFRKCLYPVQKFDSDSERRFAVVLERDDTVIKWFRPGINVFRIYYNADSAYEPDFAVEAEIEKLICEIKASSELQEPDVVAKAKAAVAWCEHATRCELANGGKPWRYVLIPHDVIAENMTVAWFVKTYGRKVTR